MEVSMENTALVATPAAAPVFWANTDHSFVPRKGFEAVLYAALTDQRSAAEVLTHLTETGEYARVAPQALALRPLKPINFLLKTWTAAGILRRSN
jgi:hypothetical protein